jgi:hypothetical protein
MAWSEGVEGRRRRGRGWRRRVRVEIRVECAVRRVERPGQRRRVDDGAEAWPSEGAAEVEGRGRRVAFVRARSASESLDIVARRVRADLPTRGRRACQKAGRGGRVSGAGQRLTGPAARDSAGWRKVDCRTGDACWNLGGVGIAMRRPGHGWGVCLGELASRSSGCACARSSRPLRIAGALCRCRERPRSAEAKPGTCGGRCSIKDGERAGSDRREPLAVTVWSSTYLCETIDSSQWSVRLSAAICKLNPHRRREVHIGLEALQQEVDRSVLCRAGPEA